MPLLFCLKMFTPKDRREFLKILIGGTGAAYLAIQGCGKDASTEIKNIVGPHQQARLKRQRHAIAHAYLRDKSFDANKLNRTSLQTDIVIIGAGASGLAAGLTLQDAGYSVLILENEHQIGGAGIKGSMHGIAYPYGSVYFVEETEEILSICKRAGIESMPAPEDAVLFKGALIENFWSDSSIDTLPISSLEKNGCKRFRDLLLHESFIPSYPLSKQLSPQEAQLDGQTSRSFLKQYQSPFLETMLDIYSKSSMGASIDETNAFCLLNFFSSELGSEFGKKRYTFPGGMNALYTGIASLIKPDFIKTNHLAFSVKNTKDGVEVQSVNDELSIVTVKAKKVIMAGPKHIAPFMIQDLPDDQKTAMLSMKYPPYATIHMSMKEEIFPGAIMDVWTPEANGFCTDIICSNAMQNVKLSEQAYVYSIFGAMPHEQRSLLLDDAELSSYALHTIQKTMNYLNKPFDILDNAEVYAWGHALAIPYPGSHNGPAQTASRPYGNVFFGSSDNDAASSVENALANGFTTAKEIIASLS